MCRLRDPPTPPECGYDLGRAAPERNLALWPQPPAPCAAPALDHLEVMRRARSPCWPAGCVHVCVRARKRARERTDCAHIDAEACSPTLLNCSRQALASASSVVVLIRKRAVAVPPLLFPFPALPFPRHPISTRAASCGGRGRRFHLRLQPPRCASHA